MSFMRTFSAKWRQRRRIARGRREIDQAIARAPSPSMRHELLAIANRGEQIFG